MEQFDVIIVGGGPAGLECARELSGSDKRVLLLEKQDGFGDKLCAGGLTLKDMQILPLPDQVIEQKILHTSIHSRRRSSGTVTKEPFIFTVNRKVLGDYQRSLLEGTGVEVRNRSQVVKISDHHVVLKDGTAIGFRQLVGAEGYNSLVRRHLGMKMEKRLIGFQYTIPVKEEYPALEIHMDARRFSAWYAWIFPHKDTMAVGCCCDPRKMDPKKLKAGFHQWLKDKKIDPGDSSLESYPIAYDYQGVKFGNTFLAGEAAGLASGLTGEGIYQSLASGQEVARMILDPEYEPEQLEKVLKYNRAMEQVLLFFRRSGLLRGAVQELLLILMNTDWIREKVRHQFSPSS
jgi:geranylgeranyl reductase